MPDVIPVGDRFTVAGADITDNTATITRNLEPYLITQAVQDPNDASKINIGIFSTTYLVDQDVSVVDTEPTEDSTAGEIYVQPPATGTLSNVVLSGDKRNITATYEKGENDADVVLVLAVHYGDDATTKRADLGFNVNTLAKNGDVVNVHTAGQVKLGNGDASQMYMPAGAFDTDGGKVNATIEKTDEEPGALAISAASMRKAQSRGAFAEASVTPLPDGVSAAGSQYNFNVEAATEGGTVTQKTAVTVQVEYDPAEVTDPDELNIWHLVDGTWTEETRNRTVDTENHTISVDVTSLSAFVPAVGAAAAPIDDGGDDGGGGITWTTFEHSSGGCFISTSSPEVGIGPVIPILAVALLVVGFVTIRLRVRTLKKNS